MIDGTRIDYAENLDLVMPMYNLIEYDSNYSKKRGSFWLYFKDEGTNFSNNISNTNNFISFKYKAKLLEKTVAQPVPNAEYRILRNAIIAVSLKHLSNFCRWLEMPLINCKVELKLTWPKYCVLSAAGNGNNINGDANANKMFFLLTKTQNYMFL